MAQKKTYIKLRSIYRAIFLSLFFLCSYFLKCLSFISALIFFIIIYFVLNLLKVNKLQEDIAKKIREEKRKK